MEFIRKARAFTWKSIKLCGRIIKRVAIFATVFVGLIIIFSAITIGVVWGKANSALKDVPALTNPSAVTLPAPVTVYSADGVRLGTTIVQNRIIIPENRIGENIENAIISIEDQRFYQHHGVDWNGVVRAAIINARNKQSSQGASTITMQYVNNVYLSRHKTLLRKLNQAALAIQLESLWTKKRILTAYLNTIYYGNGAYGIEAASRYYFGVHANELTIAQSATLAGLVQNPAAHDPYNFPENSISRRNTVLNEMYYNNYINLATLNKAKKAKMRLRKQHSFNKPKELLLFNYAIIESKKVLSEQQLSNGGYRINTTFNMKLINKARNIIAKQYSNTSTKPAITISNVDPQTGAIITIAQSKYKKKAFNLATQAQRQPGSTVKGFTLATTINNGGALSDSVDNSPAQAKVNSSKTITISPSHSAATLLDAITWSQNPAFYRQYQIAGPRKVLSLQKKLGMKHMDSNPAAGLGGTKYGTSSLEMASAYGGFADNGNYHSVYSIATIHNRTGDKIYQHKNVSHKVLNPEVARVTNAALQNVVNNGFPLLQENLAPVKDNYPMAGKTGTSQDNADAWFVGYTPRFSTAVWTGFPSSRKPMNSLITGGVTGSSIPAEVWSDYSKYALNVLNIAPVKFSEPRGLVKIPSVKGKTLIEAQTILAADNIQYVSVPIKSDTRAPGSLIAINPKSNSWIKKDKVVKLTYAVNQRAMPNLIGKDYLTARRMLGKFTSVTEKIVATSSNTRTGQISQQYPVAGTIINITDPVTVTIKVPRAPAKIIKKKVTDPALVELNKQLSNQVVVPSVMGLSSLDAKSVLLSLGFRVSNQARGGLVGSQSLTAGTRVKIGSRIIIYN